MEKTEQMVLLYSFADQEKLQKIKQVLARLRIKTKELPDDMHRQKIGYLVGSKGFSETVTKQEADFVFPHECMIFYKITPKRLDQVLLEMKKAEIDHVKFKAMVTPFNMFWTLRRLCETIQKEHAALLQKEEKQDEKQ